MEYKNLVWLVARCNEMDITEQLRLFGDALLPYRALIELRLLLNEDGSECNANENETR